LTVDTAAGHDPSDVGQLRGGSFGSIPIPSGRSEGMDSNDHTYL
jgi:hypothetical protein